MFQFVPSSWLELGFLYSGQVMAVLESEMLFFLYFFYWIRILSHRYEVIDNGGLLCSCPRDKT